MALTVTIAAQLFGVPGWTDLTRDAIAENLHIEYGIAGNTPEDSLASEGTCTFSLRGKRNSAGGGGTPGWYSPLHANVRPGWTFDIPIRVIFSDTDVDAVVTLSSLFVGGTQAIATTSGAHGYTTGNRIQISGATVTRANGIFSITVLTSTTFAFDIENDVTLRASASELVACRESVATAGSLYARVNGESARLSDSVATSYLRLGVSLTDTMRLSESPTALIQSTGTVTAQRVYIKFTGKIHTIEPEAGERSAQRVHVTAYDGMRDIIDADLRDVPLLLAANEASATEAALNAIPSASQPPARDIDGGLDLLPYVFDNLGSGTKCGTFLADLNRSTFALAAMLGDGTYRHVNRNTRATSTSVYTFDNVMSGLDVPSSLENVFNDIRIVCHPRTVDTSAVVLYALSGEPPRIDALSTVTFTGSFRNPDNPNQLIGGIVTSQPVANTDYAGNSASNGTGTDATASLTVSVTVAGSTVTISVSNTSTSEIYLVNGSGQAFLQVRGFGLYDISSFAVRSRSGKADRAITIDQPLQSDGTISQQIADLLNNQYSDITGQVNALTIRTRFDAALMGQGLAREPFDVITVTEPATGVSAVDAMILSCAYDVGPGNVLTVRWGLGPVVTITPPNDPSNLVATIISDASVQLSWDGQAGAYTQLFVNDVYAVTVGIGVTSLQITGLTPATDYTFTAKHTYFGLPSGFSNTAMARPTVVASGGVETTGLGTDGVLRKFHTFTTSGTFTVSVRGTITREKQAGGGGGGGSDTVSGSDQGGGGGGAGGRVTTTDDEPTGSHAIVIGAGGSPGVPSGGGGGTNGTNGNATTYRSESVTGGGYGAGGGVTQSGNNGGSGGGGSGPNAAASGGAGAVGQGNSGGAGGFNPGGASAGGGGGGKGGPGGAATGLLGGTPGLGATGLDGLDYARGGKGGRGQSSLSAGRTNRGDGGDGGQVGTDSGNGHAGSDGCVVCSYPI